MLLSSLRSMSCAVELFLPEGPAYTFAKAYWLISPSSSNRERLFSDVLLSLLPAYLTIDRDRPFSEAGIV